jgi:tetratricopeptide (TPR) repeat protein
VELGECWQHLRQFDKALAYYQEAISGAGSTQMGSGVFGGNEPSSMQKSPPPKTPDPHLLARYRAAVLAAAMGKLALAHEQLAAIVVVDPSFKDARERLDKLGLS